MSDQTEQAKEAAGRHAATYVRDGMRVGLGTGSTVHWTIVALGESGLDIICAATSDRTDELARSVGLTVKAPDELEYLDVAIDGADEVDAHLNLTKGGGGALTREKVIGQMAERFIVVVDENKLVDRLGPFGTPVELLRFAPGVVAKRLRALGATEVAFRPEVSDNGALLADARFGPIDDPAALSTELDAIPGLIEHGLFLSSMVERVVVAGADGVRELVR